MEGRVQDSLSPPPALQQCALARGCKECRWKDGSQSPAGLYPQPATHTFSGRGREEGTSPLLSHC